MSSTKKNSGKTSSGKNARSFLVGSGSLVWLSLSVLLCGFPALAQSQQIPPAAGVESGPPSALGTGASAGEKPQDQSLSGSISGTIVDGTGGVVAGAHVRLTREDQSLNQEVQSDDAGQFSFANIAPGPFRLTITSAGLATQTFSGTLHSGEISIVPQIVMAVATAVTEVDVVVPRSEVAEEQIKEQEKQRVFGVFPNFYVSYIPNAAPLTSKQKFELAWKATIDPVNFVLIGGVAGIQQAQNSFGGYGQGAAGYGRRYGASFGDFVTGTFIGGAILPSLLKQDPRYFYKGSGSTHSRILYAIATSVICKGDNGHWQANYSGILGSLASGGISNAYYPGKDRGAALVFENALVGIGETAFANLLQEFLVRKWTPNLPNHQAAGP